MAQKKSRQTFEKLKREQAVKEKRALKQERKKAAKLAKALGEPPAAPDADAEAAEQESAPWEPETEAHTER